MKFRISIFILLCLGCYKKNDASEAITIQDIQFKTTLKNHTPGVDYIVNKSLNVNKELIIEEGVEIRFEDACGIYVVETGSIHINGSSSKPVRLKSKNESGKWNGIHISSSQDNQIHHAEISGAGHLGNNHAAIEINALGQLTIRNSQIKDNAQVSGILLTEQALCQLENCQLSGNLFPVQMDLYAQLKQNNCDFSGNQHDMIRVFNRDGSALYAGKALKIAQVGLPYFFTSSLLLNTSTVTIDAGTHILFETGHGISTISSMVNGLLLQVNGQAGKLVKFGSFHNGPNDLWRGFTLTSGQHKIQYALFEKAYTGGKTLGTLSAYGYCNLDCKNSTFNADVDFCNISIFGKYVVYNSDINSRNTFKNSKLPCLIQ